VAKMFLSSSDGPTMIWLNMNFFNLV